eukprot:1157805-Pelagomonas_calceolata.AAC.5
MADSLGSTVALVGAMENTGWSSGGTTSRLNFPPDGSGSTRAFMRREMRREMKRTLRGKFARNEILETELATRFGGKLG